MSARGTVSVLTHAQPPSLKSLNVCQSRSQGTSAPLLAVTCPLWPETRLCGPATWKHHWGQETPIPGLQDDKNMKLLGFKYIFVHYSFKKYIGFYSFNGIQPGLTF